MEVENLGVEYASSWEGGVVGVGEERVGVGQGAKGRRRNGPAGLLEEGVGQGWDGKSGRKGDGERRARDGVSPVCQPASLVYAPGHPPALQVAIPDFDSLRAAPFSRVRHRFFFFSFLPSFVLFSRRLILPEL